MTWSFAWGRAVTRHLDGVARMGGEGHLKDGRRCWYCEVEVLWQARRMERARRHEYAAKMREQRERDLAARAADPATTDPASERLGDPETSDAFSPDPGVKP